ncbi:hypothetical protein DPMN_151987 [Dreissena polymorpha]|uniref:Uncharacterized protein n=1 Tax=Dreissena polymorpha TaxID=45954 RepID=A0A9D4FJJ8_DREPO|nr:hypothetical protein DPMN_151987 [Dreissena polymorpha]
MHWNAEGVGKKNTDSKTFLHVNIIKIYEAYSKHIYKWGGPYRSEETRCSEAMVNEGIRWSEQRIMDANGL